MKKTISPIAPCLWFDDEAEEAAQFYVKVFKNSRIREIARYSEAGQKFHRRPAGSVMIVDFELEGQRFTALNGGPRFRFNEAVSFQIYCANQKEIDYYWAKLTKGGDKKAQQCGWLKDKFGLSWQIVPTRATEMMRTPTSPGSQRAMEAMMRMKKPNLAQLERAYATKKKSSAKERSPFGRIRGDATAHAS